MGGFKSPGDYAARQFPPPARHDPREEARRDVFDYIEMFYNPRRKHARNGMLSPVNFERQQKLRHEGV